MGYGWIELRSSLSPADVSNSDGEFDVYMVKWAKW